MNRFLKKLLLLVGTPVCPLCNAPLPHAEDCLCIRCLRQLIAEERRVCPSCEKTAVECRCGTEHFPSAGLANGQRSLSHTFYTGYSDTAAELTVRLVYTAKQHDCGRLHRYAAGTVAADIRNLFADCGEDISEWVCTFPPRSAKGYRKYGFDQGEEMARYLAKELGISYRKLFIKRAGTEQKKAANAEKRRENIENSLFLRSPKGCLGMKILLFDDIITSGATMIYAANLLYEGGAIRVFPVSYARTRRGAGGLQARTPLDLA